MFVEFSPVCNSNPDVYSQYLALEAEFLKHGFSGVAKVGECAGEGIESKLVEVYAGSVGCKLGCGAEGCGVLPWGLSFASGAKLLVARVGKGSVEGSGGVAEPSVALRGDEEVIGSGGSKRELDVSSVGLLGDDDFGGDAQGDVDLGGAEVRGFGFPESVSSADGVGVVGGGGSNGGFRPVETGQGRGEGDVVLKRGVHWKKNRDKRYRAKVKSQLCGQHGVEVGSGSSVLKQGFVGSLDEEQRKSLLSSRATMMEMQNRLAQEKAGRELEVLKAVDLELEKRKNIARVRAATERSMVSIEKAHAVLVATDNVPRDQLDHDVHTVLTDGVPGLSSGSISPNSSASMAEYRAMQKENLDLKDKYDKLLAALEKIGLTERVLPYVGKDLWSVDSNGAFVEKSESLFDEVYPDGFAIDPDIYYVDGKPKKRVF